MQNLRVTLVQANQIWENKSANFANYNSLLSETFETDLIVLPEMFNTGFTMNVFEMAENYVNSESINWLVNLSKEKNAAIYTSLIIEENHNYYNRGVFIQPNGAISTYDKRQTFGLAGEDKIFQSGKNKTIVEYKDWRINLQICYDLRFPEICLNTVENNRAEYDLSLYVANWPEKRIAHWNALLVARAIENQSFVVGVNRVGVDENRLIYNGYSQINTANGLTETMVNVESAQTFVLEETDLLNIRMQLPFIKDRKC